MSLDRLGKKPQMDTDRHGCGNRVRQDQGWVRQKVFLMLTQGHRGHGGSLFNKSCFIFHIFTETGTGETKGYGVRGFGGSDRNEQSNVVALLACAKFLFE